MNNEQDGTNRSTGRLGWGRLLLAALVAAAAAAAANAVVYLLASVAGFISSNVSVGPEGQALNLFAVITASIIGAVGATVVLAVLNLLLRRPVPVFYAVSAVVLLLSFYTPTTIPDAPLVMVLTLEFMHVVAAVVIVSGLTILPRKG